MLYLRATSGNTLPAFFFLGAVLAYGQSIDVQNQSFEAGTMPLNAGMGPYSNVLKGSTAPASGTLPDWTAHATTTNAMAGAYAPNPMSRWWSGNNVGYIYVFGPGAASLSQTLPVTLQNGVTYKLSATLGKVPNFGLNYSLSLWAGETMLAFSSALQGTPNFISGADSVTFTSGPNHPLAGKPLTVMIVAAVAGSAQGNSGLFIDDIKLAASGLPSDSAAGAQSEPQQRGVAPVKRDAAAGGEGGAYYALVIGIDQYHEPLPSLKTAAGDAEAMAKLLSQRYGFQVKLLLNGDATRANILNALNQYRRSLHEADSLLIYYAGHGSSDKEADKAYWLPADAERDTSSNWIIADELTTDIRVQPARHVLVISDSCYSGGLTRDADTAVKPSERQVYLRKMLAGKSRNLMSSGGNEPVADGGGNGHSVFANAVLGALENVGDDEFTAEDLFEGYVKQRVAGSSSQIPQYTFIRNSDHANGDFVFKRATAPGKVER